MKYVRNSEKSTALTRYFQTKVVVIEVKDGETQEQAWQRHLATDPATTRAVIKVFHYPPPKARKTAKGHQVAPHFKKP
jgi:hypothetical protein